MLEEQSSNQLASLTADIVSAYVANNLLSSGELPSVIASVHQALARTLAAAGTEQPTKSNTPAVPVKRSVTPDYIVCLEDGRSFKSMKRHLQTSYGLTPSEYRAKWELPSDYPMVAPNYAAKRSALAKSMGLGTRVSGEVQSSAAPAPAPAKRRGRPRKMPA